MPDSSLNSSTTPSFKLNTVSPSLTAILKPNTPILKLFVSACSTSACTNAPAPFNKSVALPGKFNFETDILDCGDMSALVIVLSNISSEPILLFAILSLSNALSPIRFLFTFVIPIVMILHEFYLHQLKMNPQFSI